MRKNIRINYVGWWKTFDYKKCRIQKILEKYYEVEISDEPDYVFCSVYGNNEFLKYDKCIRIFYTAENVIPDFNLFDYCIGFDELAFGDRYIRIPNFIMNLKYEQELVLMQNRHIAEREIPGQFCSYVCSNGNADKMRDYIYDEISKYKKIASGGRYRNNIGLPDGVSNKLEFQRNYKFSLALENTSYRGYTTEKLIDAFASGGIPIYWGDPEVGRYFNTKAFVDIRDYPSIEDAIEEIKRIDSDDTLYQKYVENTALVDKEYLGNAIKSLELFLCNIIEQPLENAYRRLEGAWSKYIAEIVEKGRMPQEKSAIRFSERLQSRLSRLLK